MNIADTIRIMAGGEGSGCHGPNCGRPSSADHGFKEGSNIHGLLTALQGKQGEWVSITKLAKDFPGVDVKSRVGIIAKRGIERQLWKIEYGTGDLVRLAKVNKEEVKESVDTTKAFYQMLSGANDGVQLKDYMKQAVDTMVAKGIDTRLITKVPLEFVIHEKVNKGYLGLYDEHYQNDHGGVIHMLMSADAKGMAETFIHEFGHHLDYAYLRNTAANDHRVHDALDAKATKALTDGMSKEFVKASLKAAEDTGIKFTSGSNKGLFNAAAAKWGTVKTDGPSQYGLTNRREWVAEAVKYYFKNDDTRARLKEKTPKTYELIDSLVTGKLFK